MSVQGLTWAIAQTDLSASEKLTLICLANYAGPDGECFPGQKTLSTDTGLTDRTVRTALTRLEEKGLITRQRRSRQDGTRTSDQYQLCIDDNRKQIPVGEEDNRKSTTGQPEIISGQYKPNGLSEPVSEPSETRTRTKPQDFDVWYGRYPHKVGKIAAQKAFAKAVASGVSFQHLIDGLENYISSKPPDRPWCNPATWLNQGRWEDEYGQNTGNTESPATQLRRKLAEQHQTMFTGGASNVEQPGGFNGSVWAEDGGCGHRDFGSSPENGRVSAPMGCQSDIRASEEFTLFSQPFGPRDPDAAVD